MIDHRLPSPGVSDDVLACNFVGGFCTICGEERPGAGCGYTVGQLRQQRTDVLTIEDRFMQGDQPHYWVGH